MAAVRGGDIAALLLLVAALALSLGSTPSAALGFSPKKTKPQQPPTTSRPGDPNKAPRNAKFTPVINRFHKKNYEITCTTEWGASCFVKCPARCPNKCLAYCAYCITFCMCDLVPNTSCGDPRFTGADGNTFYFHGKKDESFCLVSDERLHINARFMGNHNAHSGRDFTWVQALGVTFFANNSGDQSAHRLYVGARRAAEWDEDEDHVVVALDGEPVDVEATKGARWASTAVPGLTVTRTDAVNAVVVELDGAFAVSANAVPITDEDSRVHAYGKTHEDSLVHLDVSYQFHGGVLTGDVDGVLGQTYRPDYVNKLDIGAKMPVMGGADRYRSSGLFATDCAVSRFHHDGSAGGGHAVFTSFAS